MEDEPPPPPPECIYCPNIANTVEHIIAAKFVDVLRRDPRGLPLPATMTQWYGTEASVPDFEIRKIGGKTRKRRSKRKGVVKPRQHTIEFIARVCDSCN